MAQLTDEQWLAVRAAYEASDISIRALARQYEISDARIHQRRAREGWQRQESLAERIHAEAAVRTLEAVRSPARAPVAPAIPEPSPPPSQPPGARAARVLRDDSPAEGAKGGAKGGVSRPNARAREEASGSAGAKGGAKGGANPPSADELEDSEIGASISEPPRASPPPPPRRAAPAAPAPDPTLLEEPPPLPDPGPGPRPPLFRFRLPEVPAFTLTEPEEEEARAELRELVVQRAAEAIAQANIEALARTQQLKARFAELNVLVAEWLSQPSPTDILAEGSRQKVAETLFAGKGDSLASAIGNLVKIAEAIQAQERKALGAEDRPKRVEMTGRNGGPIEVDHNGSGLIPGFDPTKMSTKDLQVLHEAALLLEGANDRPPMPVPPGPDPDDEISDEE